MGRDYYSILGIPEDASDDEIRRAFRGLAHVYHPDKESGDEKIFKNITEAYTTLIDRQRRKEYDEGARKSSSKEPKSSSPPPKTELSVNRAAYWPLLVFGTVAVLSIIGLATSNTGSPVNSTPQPVIADTNYGESDLASLGQEPSDFAEPEADQMINLGSDGATIQNGDITASALSITNLGNVLSNSYGYATYNTRQSAGHFVEVTFTATNQTNTNMLLRLYAFALKDQSEREFLPEQIYNCDNPSRNFVQTSTGRTAAMSYVTLKPGIPCTWKLLFEVSNDSASFNLESRFN